VIGDTVGDPFKDTCSVALNPVIKFTTLFGLLAVEIAVTMQNHALKLGIACLFFAIALVFVHRSFYGMRIPEEKLTQDEPIKAASKRTTYQVDSTTTATNTFTTKDGVTLKL
jgi:hypothetical protein